MIKEQKLQFISNPEEILKKLTEGVKYIDEKENIVIHFYGDKEKLKNKSDNENLNENDDDINDYLVGKYKDIYIGCLSINNPDSREKFGLNKYYKDYFYIGQWKENQKNGIGFLKMRKNILYLGEFLNNQFDGFGMLYYKDTGYFYLGTFKNGQMDKGVYYNNKLGIFYNGSFKEGKKNDKLCSYFDLNNNHVFIGEVKDDIFVSGYLSLVDITELQKSVDIYTTLSCEKIIYFDKSDLNKIKYEYGYSFENDFFDNIQNLFLNIYEKYFELSDIHDNYVIFFENLENIVYNDSYTEYIDRYNPGENSFIENTFMKNYQIYYQSFIQIQEKLNLESKADIFKGEPKINKDIKMEIKE